ncbi:MAG: GNAT family N-acetyltransferase [Bacteroidetes bacterium]|nr:GNAT family N-acetyltransferase [Bacteroidota bacterium]
MRLQRTDSSHPDFEPLVRILDSYLAVLDGDEHEFYAQFNKTDKLKHVVIAFEHDVAVGCGAIRPLDDSTMEVKRMYVAENMRGKGIGAAILKELEEWAVLLDYHVCVLETGKRQLDAIALYQKEGYVRIENYGQYRGMDNSVCFRKELGRTQTSEV